MVSNRIGATLAVVGVSFLMASCKGEKPEDTPPSNRTPTQTETPVAQAELDSVAREIVGFLRDSIPFERLNVADTVRIYVSPEGGGGHTALSRDALRRSADWKVRSRGQLYSLVPPKTVTKLTTRPGKHLNCKEYPLSSRVPELATFPHVGTKLEPDSVASCLQSWNVTFVFDLSARPLRLIAAVYDQWEW
jgi:hypothetical protein